MERIVAVGSSSIHKIQPTIETHPGWNVIGKKARSLINEQPFGDEETLIGASNRRDHTKELLAGTVWNRILVVENGIMQFKFHGETKWIDRGWVIVESPSGIEGIAHSAGIELDPKFVQIAEKRGFETTTVGSVMAEYFKDMDPTDPHNFLTNWRVSRAEMLKQTILTAVGQLEFKEKQQT